VKANVRELRDYFKVGCGKVWYACCTIRYLLLLWLNDHESSRCWPVHIFLTYLVRSIRMDNAYSYVRTLLAFSHGNCQSCVWSNHNRLARRVVLKVQVDMSFQDSAPRGDLAWPSVRVRLAFDIGNSRERGFYSRKAGLERNNTALFELSTVARIEFGVQYYAINCSESPC
jgi:hypothetical protein